MQCDHCLMLAAAKLWLRTMSHARTCMQPHLRRAIVQRYKVLSNVANILVDMGHG